MMRKILSVILALNACLLYGQSTPAREALDNFNRGVEAFQQNEFIKADSLFTVAIKIHMLRESLFSDAVTHILRQAFYNRAVTRFMLNDSCSACKDLQNVMDMFKDDSAKMDYKRYCTKSYSDYYYDDKFQKVANTADHAYYEETLFPKCEPDGFGIIHKKGSTQTLTRDMILSDVCATYNIIDSIKFYDNVFSSYFYSNNKDLIDKFNGRLKQYLNAKYNFKGIPDDRRFLYVMLFLNKEGAVSDAKIESSPFALFDTTAREVLETDIISSLKQMPVLEPVQFLNDPVNFMFRVKIDI